MSSLPPQLLDIPHKVETPSQSTIVNQVSISHLPPSIIRDGDELVQAVLKYHNLDGRNAILSVAKIINHDFGPLNKSLSVSLPREELDKLKKHKNVEWYEGDGKVLYCSIR